VPGLPVVEEVPAPADTEPDEAVPDGEDPEREGFDDDDEEEFDSNTRR